MTIKALNQEDVKFIAVHCSASWAGADVGVKEIDRWHRDRGCVKVGYHVVIRRNGAIEEGRKLTERGAHIEDFNHCSIGICMVGGVNEKGQPQDNFTEAQYASLKLLLGNLKATFPEAVIQGHRDFPNVAKACPSFDVKSWLAEHPL